MLFFNEGFNFVNGFITAVVKPVDAPINTIAVPVNASNPRASARRIKEEYRLAFLPPPPLKNRLLQKITS